MKKAFLILIVSLSFNLAQAVISSGTRDLANQLGAVSLVEIDFGPNNIALTENNKEELRAVINEAKQKGKLEEVKVLAWSDKAVSPKDKSFSKQDVKLAKNRMMSIKQYLKEQIDVADVDTFNMAEKPNKLEQLLKTEDAKIKNEAISTGAAPRNKDDLGIFGEKSQASKAVVMVFIED